MRRQGQGGWYLPAVTHCVHVHFSPLRTFRPACRACGYRLVPVAGPVVEPEHGLPELGRDGVAIVAQAGEVRLAWYAGHTSSEYVRTLTVILTRNHAANAHFRGACLSKSGVCDATRHAPYRLVCVNQYIAHLWRGETCNMRLGEKHDMNDMNMETTPPV